MSEICLCDAVHNRSPLTNTSCRKLWKSVNRLGDSFWENFPDLNGLAPKTNYLVLSHLNTLPIPGVHCFLTDKINSEAAFMRLRNVRFNKACDPDALFPGVLNPCPHTITSVWQNCLINACVALQFSSAGKLHQLHLCRKTERWSFVRWDTTHVKWFQKS